MKITLVYSVDVAGAEMMSPEDAVMQAAMQMLGDIMRADSPEDQLNVYDEVILGDDDDEEYE